MKVIRATEKAMCVGVVVWWCGGGERLKMGKLLCELGAWEQMRVVSGLSLHLALITAFVTFCFCHSFF